MNELIEDVAELSSIPQRTLLELNDITIHAIGHAFYEKLSSGGNTLEYDVGCGTLIIRVQDDKLFYKFIPSDTLEDVIVDANNGVDPLFKKTINSLDKRLSSAYKRLL